MWSYRDDFIYLFFHVTQVECIIYRYFYVRSSYLLTLFSLTETQGVFLLVFYAHSFFFFFLKLSLVLTLYLQQGSSHCHGHDFVGMILHYTEYKAQWIVPPCFTNMRLKATIRCEGEKCSHYHDYGQHYLHHWHRHHICSHHQPLSLPWPASAPTLIPKSFSSHPSLPLPSPPPFFHPQLPLLIKMHLISSKRTLCSFKSQQTPRLLY